MNWEYRVCESATMTVAQLNKWGSDGWELCGILSLHGRAGSSTRSWIFKRPTERSA